MRSWLLPAAAVLLMSANGAVAARSTTPPGPEAVSSASQAPSAPLVLAYYYIWYEPQSWRRAKTDLPALGTYASDDPTVITRHLEWAKAAGIDALIVSWKREARLDRPLRLLVDEAERQGIGLVLLYQGLDFAREPLPAARVAGDLIWFAETYGSRSAFTLFGAPAVIWSGSWKFTEADLRFVRDSLPRAGRLLLLGSEKSAQDYGARAGVFDGDAYYWSSADPLRTPGHAARLQQLGLAVAEDDGVWIAPVAPGFDARMVGGSSVVARRDGETYAAAWEVAIRTAPQAIGVISWNEFSENSHIEPSEGLGDQYLRLTADLVAPLRAARGLGPPPLVAGGNDRAGGAPSLPSLPGLSAPRPDALDALASAMVGLAVILAVAILGRQLRRRPGS